MSTPLPSPPPFDSPWMQVRMVFVDCRQRGVGLSLQDETTLQRWESDGHSPYDIVTLFLRHKEICLRENRRFPQSLQAFDRQVQGIRALTF